MKQLIVRKVYVSLDSLFDLRQGTLTFISPKFAVDVTKRPGYFTRLTDDFATEEQGALSKTIYNQLSEKFKDDIVKASLTTKIFPFLLALTKEFIKQSLTTPYFTTVEIDVNLYPYRFSDAEAKTLLESLVQRLGKLVSINLISKSPEELSVDYVTDNYLAMVMYDYTQWFNANDKALRKKPLTQTGLYVPKLYNMRTLTETEEREFKKFSTDPFSVLVRLLKPFATVQFLPIALFSIDVPQNLEEYSALIK